MIVITVVSWGCAKARTSDEGAFNTNLERSRSLSELDSSEVRELCRGQLAYADRLYREVGGIRGASCIGVVRDADDVESCEREFAECVGTEPLDLVSACMAAHPVPECDPSATLALFEHCSARSIENWMALGIDCSLAGASDEIDARFGRLAVPEECDVLTGRECAIFAPVEAP